MKLATAPNRVLTFDEKVARKEAWKEKLTSETPDPDTAALRTFSQTDKARKVRARFFAWRSCR